MKLLLVMLLVSGLLIGESRAQGPILRFFGNFFLNLRNRLGLGSSSSTTTSTTSTTSTTLQTTVTVTKTVTEAIGLSPNVELVSSILFEPEINTEQAILDLEEMFTTSTATEETITEGSSTEITTDQLIFKVELATESTTPAENDQVELEIVTEGPELDHSDATVIEALAQVMLQVPTTTPESLTTQTVVSETEAIVVKDVPPVATTPSAIVLNSTTFSTLAPKRTIHFSRPSWTPTFLKLANRGSTSRYFFPATFRRPKDSRMPELELEAKSFSLSPSKPLSVENSVAPRIPYVVKRHVEIESSMIVSNQRQSSASTVRAATD